MKTTNEIHILTHPGRPTHWFVDDTYYFLTASTHYSQHHLDSDEHKAAFRDILWSLAYELGLTIDAWVVLDNHYHLLFHLLKGLNLQAFVKRLHGGTAVKFNQLSNTPGRKVWHNYWDRCIRSERDYWTRFNYIHYNPIKHGYVTRMSDYPFSSIRFYEQAMGLDWLADIWRAYPCKLLTIDNDIF